MKMLFRKSLRSLRMSLGQCVALAAVVAGGVAAYYGSTATLAGLVASRNDYYRESRFADHYYNVTSAPQSLAKTLRSVPGVLDVTPRIYLNVKIVRKGAARETGRLISCDDLDIGINRVKVLAGRRMESNGSMMPEVMIDRQYAAAHGLEPGATLEIIAKGRRHLLKVVGIVTSPEFLFKKMSPLEFPGWGGVGIILTDLVTAQGIFGSPGEVNQFLLRYAPGGEKVETNRRVTTILSRYGITGDSPLEDHQSHRYINTQIKTVELASALLPPWIFFAALLMQAISLRRMIRGECRQIGIFKAVGYDQSTIILAYAIPALSIGLLGSVAGIICGIGLTALMGTLLERAIDLHITGGVINPSIMAKTILLSLAVPFAASILTAREVTLIDPVSAFRVKASLIQKRNIFEQFESFWRIIPSSWKISLRSISRNPGRFASLTLGILISMGMLLVTLRFSDSRDTMFERHFVFENRYDYHVKFASPLPATSVAEWLHWPEIMGVESSLEIPVRLYRHDSAGMIRESRNEVLVGLNPSGSFRKAYDQDRRMLDIPDEGIMLSSSAAKSLRLAAGDRVIVETREGMGPLRRSVLLIRAVVEQHVGGYSIASLEQASRILGEHDLINSVMIRSRDPEFINLEERLVRIPEIVSILSQREQRRNAEKLTEAITWFSTVMTFLAMVIGCSIVYKNSLMSYIERSREIATLRVLGWKAQEVARMLLNEVVLAFVIGISLGFPLAVSIGSYYLQAIGTEDVAWPIVLHPGTCLISIGATGLFALAGHLLAVKRVQHQDLLEALKYRE